jgi:uncharacterized membrane protein YraQ (UPF0718 family)
MNEKCNWRTERKYRIGRIVAAVCGGLLLAVCIGLVLGILVKLLWNNTVSPLFGWPTVSYWQAVGLFILARLLFHIGHHGSNHHNNCFDRRFHHWIGANDNVCNDDPSMADENFKNFWHDEGRDAYARYCENNNDHATKPDAERH